jgi:hypothetical protein
MTKVKRAMAFGLLGTLAVGAAGELQAAPVPTNTAATRVAALSAVTDVRWRGGWGRRGWWGPGVVIGGLALGAAVAPYYYGGPYYDAGPYYYGGPYWGGYPGYWGPGSSTCWDRGRRIVCSGP